jgi:hypothetical protein
MLALLLGVTMWAPASAHARILKRLDFESGNLRQWTYVQAQPGRISVVKSPKRQGEYSARFVVKPGDVPVTSGERSEVVALTGEHGGSDSWWRWSTFFPKNFNPDHGTWNIFTQWHQTADECPPPLVFAVNTEVVPHRLEMRSRGGRLNAHNCRPGSVRLFKIARFHKSRWYTFKLHVRWSPRRSHGLLRLWVNGRQRARAHLPTLYEGEGVYAKQGFYRGPSSKTSVIYHDGMQRFRP